MVPIEYLEPAMMLPFLTASVYVLVEALKPVLALVMPDDVRRALQPWVAGVLGAVLALLFVAITGAPYPALRAATVGFFVGLSASPMHDALRAFRS